eukprot:gene7166-7380_t
MAWGARYLTAIRDGEWWRLFSSICIHGNFAHLLSNIITFVILAVPLEHSYGPLRIFIIFLAAGFGGTFLSMAFEDACMVYVGASGAVFGFLGLYLADIVLNWESIYRPLLRLALMLVSLGLTLGIEFATARTSALQKVSHMSHVGGLVLGLFVSFMFLPNLRDRRWKAARKFANRLSERWSHAGGAAASSYVSAGAPPPSAAVNRASYLQSAGVDVVPIPVFYPEVTHILGQQVYRRVQDVPGEIDILDVFRKPSDIPPHLDDIIAKKPKAVWLQSGITHPEAEEALAKAGIKTLLVEKLSAEAGFTLLAVSPSMIVSKWAGDSEKAISHLFELAQAMQPTIVFLDEVDSIGQSRGNNTDVGSRRLLTELLLQLNRVTAEDGVYIFAATNRIEDCDPALLRRFSRRIHVPLPDATARMAFFQAALATPEMVAELMPADVQLLVESTTGYSSSDLAAVCRLASMAPVKELFWKTRQQSAGSQKRRRLVTSTTLIAKADSAERVSSDERCQQSISAMQPAGIQNPEHDALMAAGSFDSQIQLRPITLADFKTAVSKLKPVT